MALRDLTSYFEDDGLEYPLPASAFTDEGRFPEGKIYRVPSPSAKNGLWLTSLVDIGLKFRAGGELTDSERTSLLLDDGEESTFYERILGSVYGEMLADGVKFTVLKRVAQDAYLCFAMSEETADQRLASSAGKAPNRQQRRAAVKAGRKSSRGSTGTAGSARATASRTSGSSTSPNARGAARKAV